MKAKIIKCDGNGETRGWWKSHIGQLVDVTDEYYYKNEDELMFELFEDYIKRNSIEYRRIATSIYLEQLSQQGRLYKKVVEINGERVEEGILFYIDVRDIVIMRDHNLEELGI